MAVNILQGFKVTSTQPIDSRIIMSKAEMRNINSNIMPDKYICICRDDGAFYTYDKTLVPSATTGYFIPYEEKIDVAKAIEAALDSVARKAALEAAVGKTLPGALKSALDDTTLAEGIIDNFNKNQFKVDSKKINLSIDSIQDTID